MKTKRLILTIFFLSLLPVLNAQELQEVLERHFHAVGQWELMRKKTHSIKATVEQMGMEIPMSIQIKRPDKFRMEMEMQGQKMIQAYDGEEGWYLIPWQDDEPKELKGNELKQAMEQANMEGELFNYATKGSEAILEGKVEIDGASMFNIKLTEMNGTSKNYYIDASDYLVKQVTAIIKTQGNDVYYEQNLSDYKYVDGVTLPYKIESQTVMGSSVIHFTEIKFNEDLDDSIFE